MDERTRRIEQGMHDAEEAGKRLASMEEERKALMVEAKAETRKMFEAAHTQSEADARDLIEKAKREVERIIVTSKTQLKQGMKLLIPTTLRKLT